MKKGSHSNLLSLALGLGICASSPSSSAQEYPERLVSPGVDNSPQHHLTLAERYHARAVEYRQSAEAYKRELKDFQRRYAMPPSKTGGEQPWVRKKRLETEKLVQEAEEHARYFERFAEYHEFRARDLQGE